MMFQTFPCIIVARSAAAAGLDIVDGDCTNRAYHSATFRQSGFPAGRCTIPKCAKDETAEPAEDIIRLLKLHLVDLRLTRNVFHHDISCQYCREGLMVDLHYWLQYPEEALPRLQLPSAIWS